MSNYTNEELADIFQALSNPHRLQLFQQMMNCCVPGTRCSQEAATRHLVGELGSTLEIAPSTLSHHLKELKRAGLINMRRQGKHVECWVEPAVLNNIACFFQAPLTQGDKHEQ